MISAAYSRCADGIVEARRELREGVPSQGRGAALLFADGSAVPQDEKLAFKGQPSVEKSKRQSRKTQLHINASRLIYRRRLSHERLFRGDIRSLGSAVTHLGSGKRDGAEAVSSRP